MMYKVSHGAIMREDGATIPEDVNNRDYREYLEWCAAGNVAEAAQPSPEELIGQMSARVQAYMDKRVGERNYGSILAACTYADSSVPQWQAEGAAAVAWRDAVWVKAFEIMAACQAGEREIPAAEALLAELPALVW